jgi:hypothetical protein
MGVVLGPLVWALVAGYWLWWRPRLAAAGRPRRSLEIGLEVAATLALLALGGWLATDSFATPTG